MKTYLRSRIIAPLLCGVAMLWLAAPARGQAVLTDISSTAPVPGTYDISQTLCQVGTGSGVANYNPAGLNYYWDQGNAPGQTFTTAAAINNSGYILNSVSLKTAGNGNSTTGANGFSLYIYSVSGTTATVITNYSFSPFSLVAEGDWIQWTNLNTYLAPNTTYAYAMLRVSGGGWEEMGFASNNVYAGGQIASIPSGGGTINFGSSSVYDASFNLGLVPAGSTFPAIITQPSPTSTTIYSNSTISYAVVGSGASPLSYQWNFNSVAIANATNATLNLSNVTTSQNGSYTVVITNSSGSVTSSVASLTVLPYPTPQTAAFGVQFAGVGQGVALTPNQVAGVYAISNWNVNQNFSVPLNNLVDYSNVNTVASLGMAPSPANSYYHSSDNTNTPDGILNSAGYWINGNWSITLTNINNYTNYDVYVYVLNDSVLRRWAATITNADVPTYWGSTTNGSSETNPYVYYQATNTSDTLTPAAMPVANYAHFTGVSGTNFKVAGQTVDGTVAIMGVEIVRNDISPTNSGIITAGTNSIFANGTSTQVITVQARYLSGANRLQGGATVVFSKTGGGTLSGTTDNGNGTYSATLTSPTTVGSATVTATLNGVAVGSGGTSPSSQTVVNFIPGSFGAVAAAYSTLSPATATLVANGTSTQVITVQARDANSNNITTGGATVVFSLSGVGTLSGTTDNGNGTYSATLTASKYVGTSTVTATVNGAAVGTAVSASNCVVTYTATGVSVQFVPPAGNSHGSQALTPGQVAGVYPLPDWNLDTNDTAVTTSALYDSLSNATATTVNVIYANGPWSSGDSLSTPDGIMMSGGFPSSGATGYTVNVANVPYESYNVYVYMLNDNNPNRRYGLTLGTQTYWAGVLQGGGVVFPAAYTQATQTTTNGFTPSTQPVATYVLFTNITGTSFTINGQTPDGVVFMMGIQVVNAATHATPPVIATQPQTAVTYLGYNATFSATAGGSTPLFYQWQKNGTNLTNGGNIAGSATNTLTVSGVGAGDIANYTLVVTNSVGSVTSSVVTITELPASARIVWSATNLITTADAVLNYGGYVVEAATFGNTNYLVTLTNGTSINFVAGGSTASVNGNGINYNGFNTPDTYNPGQTTGNANFDNVLNAFSYDGGPKYVTVKNLIPGSQYNVLLIGLLDDSSFGYRTAYFQDPLDPTDVSSTFIMSNNVYVVGTFTAVSTNQTIIEQCPLAGNGNMNALVVYASSPASPTITRQPANMRAITNTTATFTVGTTGYPLNYQWYKVSGGVTNPITGATNTSYTTPPVQDSDSGTGFFVVVSNSVTTISVTSSTAILTAGHMVTTTGFLREDQYFNQTSLGTALQVNLYPQSTWSGIGTPDKTEYLTIFDDNQDLPGNAGSRIYGWFTPPVSGDYVFFETTDDGGTLFLSTDNTPGNAYEIAQNQDWMTDRDWTCGNTNSGEYTYYQYGEWRSDLFATVGGQSPYDPANLGFRPNLNGDGGYPLVAGTPYYIELDHWQGAGGQAAAVTYKLAGLGQADPSSNSVSLLAGTNISTAIPDTLLPEPMPVITNIVVSGSNVILKGNNGLVNAVYNVLSSTNLATPLTNWTVTATHVFDINGNFNATNAITPGTPQTFYRLQAPQ